VRMKIVCLALILCCALFVSGKVVTISNVKPRADVSGVIMDIHDGNTLLLDDGLYYYYGASYGLCKEPSGSNGCADAGPGNCGFRMDHNVSLFTSPDLSTWTFRGHIWEMAKSPINGILFCPKVIYNPKTTMFVMWFNWITPDADFSGSWYAAATSSSPLGPFTLVNSNISSLAFTNTGDFNLYLDDDGQGYVIYTAHITHFSVTHRMSVERLSSDFTGTVGATGNSGFFGNSFVEAPAFFKRQETYYAVFGTCCCYCQSGSPVYIYTATNPLGPYIQQNNLGGAIPSQQTNVLPVTTPNGTEYLWQGDRWQSAPDGIKGHDFSYWGPLQFDKDGNVAPLAFQNQFTIDVVG